MNGITFTHDTRRRQLIDDYDVEIKTRQFEKGKQGSIMFEFTERAHRKIGLGKNKYVLFSTISEDNERIYFKFLKTRPARDSYVIHKISCSKNGFSKYGFFVKLRRDELSAVKSFWLGYTYDFGWDESMKMFYIDRNERTSDEEDYYSERSELTPYMDYVPRVRDPFAEMDAIFTVTKAWWRR